MWKMHQTFWLQYYLLIFWKILSFLIQFIIKYLAYLLFTIERQIIHFSLLTFRYIIIMHVHRSIFFENFFVYIFMFTLIIYWFFLMQVQQMRELLPSASFSESIHTQTPNTSGETWTFLSWTFNINAEFGMNQSMNESTNFYYWIHSNVIHSSGNKIKCIIQYNDDSMLPWNLTSLNQNN